MTTVKEVFCACVIFLQIMEGVPRSICGISSFGESLKETENDFIHIIYLFNVTESSHLHQKLFSFEVCEMTSRAPMPRCKFLWKKQSNIIAVSSSSPSTQTICSWKQRDISSSTTTFELQISQLAYRSLSLLKFSDGLESDNIVRLIHLEVLYPPTITSLTVDGQEVSSTHLIDEGQQVNITCLSEKGNPPKTFYLLDKKGNQLAKGEHHLSHSLSVRCEEDWPIVRCEGSGSKHNRSVSLLVRCAAQFLDMTPQIGHHDTYEIWTFGVRAHTTALDRCHLTTVETKEKFLSDVNCTLSGTPPELVLTVFLQKEGQLQRKHWTLTVRNEKGSSSTSVFFMSGVLERTPTRSTEGHGCLWYTLCRSSNKHDIRIRSSKT